MLAEVIHSVADFANQVLCFFSFFVQLSECHSHFIESVFTCLSMTLVNLINVFVLNTLQALLAYGLSSSRRAPDALHP